MPDTEENMHEPTTSKGKKRQYYCDCERFCKHLKLVGWSTYYEHIHYRNNAGASTHSSQSHSAERQDSTAHSAQLRRQDRGQDDCQSGQEGTSGGQEAHTPEVNPVTGSRIEDIWITEQFIQALREASLDNGDLTDAAVEDLLNPPESTLKLREERDRDLLLSLRLFLAQLDCSQDTYKQTADAVQQAHPEDKLLSYENIKRTVSKLTGVYPIIKHMCPSSCMAYTGPFESLDECPVCTTSRYDPDTGRPRQEFYTIPIGPHLQALRQHPETAQDMQYFWQRSQEILREYRETGSISEMDDVWCGTDFLQAIQDGKIKSEDTILMMSFDGAQLYRSKISDCWIYIWVVLNLSPKCRYKKRHVIPGAFIPGPSKPKIVESFLFPGLHHVCVLNKLDGRGLPVWDALRDTKYVSGLYIALATADSPGMVYLNGLAGHTAKLGCRLLCGLVGRHQHGKPIYYPALLKPENYIMAGCDHDDVPANAVRSADVKKYRENLRLVCSSSSQAAYERNHRETGICGPSIFDGFPTDRVLGIPGMFPGNIMHLILNLADLLMSLWRGTICCIGSDSKATWYWAVLQGEVWERHGRDVTNCQPFLPGSFNRPPRNPAEKINSGYKAWEWLLYLFGLGPGLFYGVLLDNVWRSYCKLVFGIRVIYQHSITQHELQNAHCKLIEFIAEFEAIYYQRQADRLHFVRQSIHQLSHPCPEVLRVGPGACSSQWLMERAIGSLTREIRSDSKPYANLSERGCRRAEVNALNAMLPMLDKDAEKEGHIPKYAVPLGDNYVLLWKRDHTDPTQKVRKWARLRLPNGQVARSVYKEVGTGMKSMRSACNVKLKQRGSMPAFAEVRYYFRLDISETGETKTLAMISLYSKPDADLLEESSHTLWSCMPQGDAGLDVINVKDIVSVVATVPHSVSFLGDRFRGRVFVVEKPGLDIAVMGGVEEDMSGDNEDEIDED
ncbi:hypothetical protein NEOLEDRAFT_1156215 [Neolentinus lepideus HHB14362 ss-1]|uniref:Uncharacterized protein n=1 Tax=Neolentinus lepideus HHB14362 ss-1 TaxID=1314782 RepID=A0A165SR17_9AGAM|nr:hypothetical protein NEOLEDRAFT_1156215 [Neolentinus lepideus HHB14362 ss-1]